MIDPGLVQDAERTHARVIWLVGFGGIAVTALVVAVAWCLVAPPPVGERPMATPVAGKVGP